ncbi:MAG: nitric-oxide reductase large subunit, partial [Candidatus Hydrogenedentes bacterium]|nr:nitric-oxide reductase large subunit [Candidatus Hydrogenedentota bacterium]
MENKRLWIALGVVLVASFTVLSVFGFDIYRQAPPIPERVVTESGQTLFTGQDIKDGQNVWQSAGGQQMGTVWGHGSYVAPDWSADFLHRECVALLDSWANETRAGARYDDLDAEQQAMLQARLKKEIRSNTYDAATGDLVISDRRAEAIRAVQQHYTALFSDDASLAELREAYAIPNNAVPDPERREKMAAFFFWASWSCGTNRPGQEITYTQNWPAEHLIDNRPTGSNVVWSVISFVLLLAGVGALAWYYAVLKHEEHDEPNLPTQDPLLALKPTPSMNATL